MLAADLLRDQALAHPDRRAVVVVGRDPLSYAGWDAGANRMARQLLARGLAPGERVGLLFDNREATTYLSAYLGIHRAGGVAVPLNVRFTHPELSGVLAHSEPRLVLHGSDHAPLLAGWTGATLASAELCQILSEGDASAMRIERSGDDLADILYTSGTTGSPKGVACTHDNIAFKGSSRLSQAFAGGRFLHAVPMFTFAGTHAMTLICLRGAMTQHLLHRFDPAGYLNALADHRVHLAYAVPAMLLRCIAHPRIEEGGFDSLRLLMYGTAPMPRHAIQQLARTLPSTFLLNLYGLTEGGAAVCSLPPHEALARPDSVGRPLPPAEVQVIDPDGQPLPAGETGEICLRAPIRPRWYWRDEAATAATWSSDGWLKTGDLGYLDADGYLYLVDRKKDLIIVGGHNVSAPEVEGVLVAHPAVQDAAVVGQPHPVMGEVPRAFVVLQAGAQATSAALQTFLEQSLAAYKVPRDYVMLEELPRNALGKVLKRVLRDHPPGGTP